VIVVADTSVILNLCFLGQEPLLPLLFGTVHAPPQVEAEFLRLANVDVRFQGLVFPGFILRTAPLDRVHAWALSPVLHSGEIAALSLALELRADLVLMDEAEGRAAATALKLTTMGLLGILLQARQARSDCLGDTLPRSPRAGGPLLDGPVSAHRHTPCRR